uniref:Platelet endothelial cell adhesion molecule n=1 Tax=Equus caballus TaxID=9796 RepID=F7DLW8_HORSE
MHQGWAREGKMWLRVLLTLLLSFTINSIYMKILPRDTVQNGENLTLQCIVDVSTTSRVKPKHSLLFYKDDVLFYNVSSIENTESYVIPQARVYDAGIYKCSVILNNKQKTTAESQVLVKGVPRPRVTLDKKETIEGGTVTVNCSVPEERAPIHFTIEKHDLDTKGFRQKREKTSQKQNFVTLEFTVEEQDRLLSFHCQASIVSGNRVETSESSRSELVTVTESFSMPKFNVSPQGKITEGEQLRIVCTIQVRHLAQFPEIIIQKDKVIVAHSNHGSEAVYSVMAMMEHNGNYTCKVEASRISKVTSIMVNITELFSKPKLESPTIRLDKGGSLDLWCSIPGAPTANFTIQKGHTVVSQSQNFTKIASKWDSGTYTCTAGIGKVVKKSNTVQIAVCEMLSKPKIFRDSKSEVIKGQAIEVSCQSSDGTSPIFYQLFKANNVLKSHNMSSNEPAVFKDNPTKDVEYYCIVDNCHSHTKMVSEVLRVKVIAPVEEVKLSILLTEVVETGKPIVLRCSVNNASGPITYTFYREKEGKPFYQVISNETQAIWHESQASKEQEGQYYCTASNRANLAKKVPQSNALTVRVFLSPWKKGLIAVVIIGVIIALLILGARCYFLKKAKAKQNPVAMPRLGAPLLNSNNEKMLSDPNTEANRHYGYSEDVGNHAMKPINENKEPLTSDVEYTEVEVTSPEPHQGLGTKGTETVYSEIRKADPDFVENRYSRTEGSLDGT